ncbi:MAG: MarR family transcriptional regulator [Chloroflexota bacterium]
MSPGFSKLQQNAWGGFLSTYTRLNRQIEEDLQEHGSVSHVEFEILLRLFWEQNHRLRIQDLTAQSILTQSGTSRAIERLEKAGLVVREAASEDRRGAYAVITEIGIERFRVVMEKHIAFVQAHFLNYFTSPELEQMVGFWIRLDENENPTCQENEKPENVSKLQG